MKDRHNIKIVLLAFIAAVFVLGLTDALAFEVRRGSVDFIMTGKFLDADGKGGSKVYEFWNKEKRWRFRVTETLVLGAIGMNGWKLLDSMGSRKIRIFGDEEILKPLYDPLILGRHFELRGKLYMNSGKFHVYSTKRVGIFSRDE